jgi:short-subunit dehydrogenase
MYAGTKAFLNAFTTALHREMRRSGVTISVLQPGPVVTEFFDQAASQKNGRRVPAERLAIPAERVAGAVWSLLRRPRRQAFVPWFTRLTPWISLLFAGVMDWVGPLLLRRN